MDGDKKGKVLQIRLNSPKQEEEIKRMAKECGFQNISEYARVSMKHYYLTRDAFGSLADINEKLDILLKSLDTNEKH